MKTVLISGGTRGIGRACVELFAKNGYNVAFIYKNSDDKAREIEKQFGAYPIKADVGNVESVKLAVADAVKRFGTVDVLINNAGVSRIGLIQDITYEQWKEVVDTNLSGALYLCKEVSSLMIRAGFGRIINIGSVWGKYGASCEAAYSATKAALRGLTTSLAKELGPSGITVNCIEPGVIETDMNAHFDAETVEGLIDSTPICRLGQPSDVAEAVFFLASDKASFITGQCIGVDGGFPA